MGEYYKPPEIPRSPEWMGSDRLPSWWAGRKESLERPVEPAHKSSESTEEDPDDYVLTGTTLLKSEESEISCCSESFSSEDSEISENSR